MVFVTAGRRAGVYQGRRYWPPSIYRRFPELALLPKVDWGIVTIAGRHFPLDGPLAARRGKPRQGRRAAGWGMQMILKSDRPGTRGIPGTLRWRAKEQSTGLQSLDGP